MNAGRLLVVAGLFISAIGLIVMLMAKLNVPIGRLPGDVVWRGKNTVIVFPLVTCLVLSALGTLVLWLMGGRR